VAVLKISSQAIAGSCRGASRGTWAGAAASSTARDASANGSAHSTWDPATEPLRGHPVKIEGSRVVVRLD
jgi:hypothetical protein